MARGEGERGGSGSGPTGDRTPLWALPALLAIALLASLIRFLPWLGAPLWGSDSGEYWTLSKELVAGGRVGASDYDGWGEAYPYFLGLEYLVGALSTLTGISVLAAMALLPALIAFPTSFLVYLIAMRVMRNPVFGLGAAGVVAVAMPQVFATSHPMPGALGDVLMIASLYFFLRRADSRGFAAALAVTVPALIMTHHLSTYIFVAAAAAGIVFREMLRARADMRRAWVESATLAAAMAATGIYWLFFAEGFRRGVLMEASPTFAPLFVPAGILGVLLIPLLIRGLRRLDRRFEKARGVRSGRYRPQLPDLRLSARRAGFFAIMISILVVPAVLWSVPGTSIRIPFEAVLLFAPLLALFYFAIIGSKVADFLPDGNTIFGWSGGIAASGLVGAITGAIALSPYRHVQYFVLPVALLAGAGMAHVAALMEKREGRKRLLALAVVGLAAASTIGAYPPPRIFAGFDESLHPEDMALVQWSRLELAHEDCVELAPCIGIRDRPVFASDHRLSSALYSFGAAYATWDTTPRLFSEESWNEKTRDECRGPLAPTAPRRVGYVAYDKAMEQGLALDPNAQASPPSRAAVEKFDQAPFVKIYDNGYARVYLLDWSRA